MTFDDLTPRYAPDTVITVSGRYPVDRAIAYPPGQHPPRCPLVPDCTALELRTRGGSRWYGCQRAYINSELRMIVVGHDRRDEVRATWPAVQEG